MITYDSNNLYPLRSDVYELRIRVDAIEKKLREKEQKEEDAKRRREYRNMMVLTVWAGVMWFIMLCTIMGLW